MSARQTQVPTYLSSTPKTYRLATLKSPTTCSLSQLRLLRHTKPSRTLKSWNLSLTSSRNQVKSEELTREPRRALVMLERPQVKKRPLLPTVQAPAKVQHLL